MSKVKLTKEQATAVEKYKNDLRFRHWQEKVNKIRNEIIIEKCLLELSTDDFMNAFEYGYEVEPEFNVGDWVHVSWSNTNPSVHKVIKTGVRSTCGNKNGIEIDWGGSPTPPLDIIRHATPEEIAEEKERRWWAKHGREPWELRKGDSLIKSGESHYPCIVCEAGDFNVRFTDGYFLGKSRIKKTYRVFCFADDRKDVDNE